MNAHNEQQPNEAVAWTVVGPDGKSSIGGWRDMGTLEFWKKMAVLREGHRYAYAAPVTEAQEAVGVDAYDDALDQLWKLAGGNDHPVYKRFLDFRDSFAAPVTAAPADAQEAVGEVVEIVDGDTVAYRGVLYATFILSDHFAPGMKLYAAPVTEAPAIDPSRLGAAMSAFDAAGGHAVRYAPEWMRKALEVASTPAAPGIDLYPIRCALQYAAAAARENTHTEMAEGFDALIRKIDASPKGGIDLSWSLHDRVEFALRDAGFDLDEAAFVAEAASVANGDLDSPKGGSEARDAVVVEGTVEFRRSSTSEPKLCVCCPGEPSHIFGRSVNWEGECLAQFNALETAIRKHFTYKNENEGRRLRVTIEVVQAQAGDAEVQP